MLLVSLTDSFVVDLRILFITRHKSLRFALFFLDEPSLRIRPRTGFYGHEKEIFMQISSSLSPRFSHSPRSVVVNFFVDAAKAFISFTRHNSI